MESWIATALWIIWVLWSIVEIGSMYVLGKHNNNQLKVAIHGELKLTTGSRMVTYLWIVLTIFWLCWHFA